MLGNHYGLELAITVTGNGKDSLAVLGLDFLGVTTVTGITTVIAGNWMFLITQMSIHLTFKHLFQHLSVELL